MKIALFVNNFLPSIGGKEIVVHYLAQAMTRLGHYVCVVGPAGFWSNRKIVFDYPIHRWPTLGGMFQEQVDFLRLFLDTTFWNYDVIHAHTVFPCGYTAAKVKKIKKLPLIITPHGSDIHIIPALGYGQRLDQDRQTKIKFAVDHADAITAISKSIKSSLVEAGAEDDHRIHMIPNGVDRNRFQTPINVDVRTKLGVSPNSRLLLTVGNYRECKGHEIIIQSMLKILKLEPNAVLVIVGRNTNILQPLIESLGLGDRIRLTGPIDFPLSILSSHLKNTANTDIDWMAALYQNSELYISAGVAEGAEGLPLTVLDSLAAGLPVVATDISGNRDVVEDGKTGLLVPPSDSDQIAKAVLEILGDSSSQENMRYRARQEAKKYDWEIIAEQYISLYENCLHHK